MEASPINAPHPDDEKDEADLFFGDPEEQAQPVPDEPTPDPTPQAESAGPTDEDMAAAALGSDEALVPAEAPEPTPDPMPSTSSDASASGEARASGQLEREYLVFHKLPLTEKALRFLLAEIEEGRAPEPRVAFFEIHRTTARNVKGAVSEAYAKHKAAIGQEADLAAVSERAFQIKHVAPKQVVKDDIQIT